MHNRLLYIFSTFFYFILKFENFRNEYCIPTFSFKLSEINFI